ncbi:AfsR family transcriptional regulator [Streptomyces solincola]|uniref:AfsR family transcriptional regulator n=1 Tax=Streptomyces solincola TaxID=2100817 RepID=A0A2S9Q2J3_9ACTN|nr:BTAD domain-containing putative transcriptional regulator [Streptomyces solincola]PRH80837.1 AfsR family transcriptional regulator [Streptomyces solincola]
MEFLVLGSLEVRRSDGPVRVRGMRQQRLLALLLLHRDAVVTVDRLVDELWDDPPPSARPQVHNAVRDLRRTLAAAEGVSLDTSDAGYRLAVPADSVDAGRFTRQVQAARTAAREGRTGEAIGLLQAGLDLWRGEAFAGITCPEVASAAVRLGEQRMTAIEELMSLRLRAGETSSLAGELRALVASHPLRDELRACLMLALFRGGRQADALAVHDEGRRLLAEEMGLMPSRRLQDLRAEILADTPTARGTGARDDSAPGREPTADTDRPADSGARTPEADGPVVSGDRRPDPAGPTAGGSGAPAPGPAAGPRNCLPHDLADFTGRSEELRTLREAVAAPRSDTPLMIAVDGMGGVGKTSLAVRLAHQVTDRYPDGQFFVNLHGCSARRPPLPAGQALALLLQASGVAARDVPDTPAERSALWRSRLAGRRCLVVLDDAEDIAQVAPLLPGAGSALVLVTSRRRLSSLDGAHPLWLDALPPADAARLFTRVAGAERTAGQEAQVARVVELCDRLPLAVRMAATRLRDRRTWTAADLADRLECAPQRARCLRTADRDLMAVLRASYRHLDPAQRRFSRLISRQPASSYDVEDAAALSGLPAGDVESLFDVLVEHNLVREDGSARFSFPSLVRDCTRELAVDGAA